MQAVTVLDRAAYDRKVNNLLSDPRTYLRDPAPALEDRRNEKLLSLKRSGSIPPPLYSKLCSSAGCTPLLYGLPKTHKPGTPLRPIVPFINSSTYQLSKHLVTILSPLAGTLDSHVQNSSDFAPFITSQTLGPDEILVLFNVVSLFTNVPVELAISVARTRLGQDTSLCDCTCLMADEVTMLLSFCLNATYCAFAGQFFKQTFGTAISSPVSVTVANLGMEDVEECPLSTYSNPLDFW